MAKPKEINAQFVPVVIRRIKGSLTGIVVILQGDTVTVNAAPADPNDCVSVDTTA